MKLKRTRLPLENAVTKYYLLDQMWCNYYGGYDHLSGVINYDFSDNMPCYYIGCMIYPKQLKISFGNRCLYIWIVASTYLFVQFLEFQFFESVLFKTHLNLCPICLIPIN